MAEPLLRIEGLVKTFGAVRATDGLDLDVLPGEIHAVIGPNGAGKTTLIAQLSGELPPDAGRMHFDGQDLAEVPPHERVHRGLARSFQITSVFPEFTALQNVSLAVQARAGHSFRFFKPVARDAGLRSAALAHLETVGLAALADTPAQHLAHGQQRQLEIAMALALDPRLLLLDEPMAGMGQEESAGVVSLLRGLKGRITMLLVEHDMDAVFALADRITVLVYGRAIATGTPDAIRDDAEVRAAYLGGETEAAAC